VEWFEIQSNNHKAVIILGIFVDTVIWPRNKKDVRNPVKKNRIMSFVGRTLKSQPDGSVTSLETDNYLGPAK